MTMMWSVWDAVERRRAARVRRQGQFTVQCWWHGRLRPVSLAVLSAGMSADMLTFNPRHQTLHGAQPNPSYARHSTVPLHRPVTTHTDTQVNICMTFTQLHNSTTRDRADTVAVLFVLRRRWLHATKSKIEAKFWIFSPLNIYAQAWEVSWYLLARVCWASWGIRRLVKRK